MALQTQKSLSVDEFAPTGRFLWAIEGFRIEEKMFEAGFNRPLVGSIAREPEPVLVIQDATNPRPYSPAEHRDLFINFSLIHDSKGVLEFAKRFGALGAERDYFAKYALQKRVHTVLGERIRVWLNQAAVLAEAVALWEAIKRDDTKTLASLIKWDHNAVRYTPRRGGSVIATATKYSPELYHSWKRGELIGPAKVRMASMINNQLRGMVAPQIVLSDSRDFKLNIRPFNLLGFIWFQMSNALTGEPTLKRCSECGELMVCERSTKTMHDRCALKARQRRYRESHNV